jgi:hypothetical protein
MPKIRKMMTWDGSTPPGRWQVKFERKRYRISARQLQCLNPDIVKALDKAGTLRAANTWWQQQQESIHAALSKKNFSKELQAIEIALEHHQQLYTSAVAASDLTAANELKFRIDVLEKRLQKLEPIRGLTVRDRLESDDHPTDLLVIQQRANVVARAVASVRSHIATEAAKYDAVLPIRRTEIPDRVMSRSVRAVANKFLNARLGDTKLVTPQGRPMLSFGRYRALESQLKQFCEFRGEASDIDSLSTSQTLSQYRLHLICLVEAERITVWPISPK